MLIMSELTESVANFFIQQVLENSSYFPFLIIMLMMTSVIAIAHFNKRTTFNFYDTLMVEGKAALEKIAAMMGYITVTWWFIDLCAKGKAGATEAGVYGGLVIAARLGYKWLDEKGKANVADTGTKPS